MYKVSTKVQRRILKVCCGNAEPSLMASDLVGLLRWRGAEFDRVGTSRAAAVACSRVDSGVFPDTFDSDPPKVTKII